MLGPLMLAVHKPEVESRSKFLEAVVFIAVAIYLVPRRGAAGVAWAGVLSYALAFILRYTVALELFQAERSNLIRDAVQLTFVAVCAYFAAIPVSRLSWVAGIACFEAVFLGLACLSMPLLRQQIMTVAGLILRRPALKADVAA
jgi:O-antigen/teichoic acid export membrane protein